MTSPPTGHFWTHSPMGVEVRPPSRVTNSTVRPLVSFPQYFPEHDWSPDGESIVVSDRLAHELGPANIALLAADGSSVSHPTFPTDFEREDQRALTPSFSPDGEWIIFRLRERDLFAIYRMRSDGGDLERVTAPSTFVPDEIDWGPAPRPQLSRS